MVKDTLFFRTDDPCSELEKISIAKECFENPVFYSYNKLPIAFDIYLHGICGIFALALNAEFGYKTYIAAEECYDDVPLLDRLVHVYCACNDVVIDVRGMTEDKERFFDEFSDFLTEDSDYFEVEPNELKQIISREMSETEFSMFYKAAQQFISNHYQDFCLLKEQASPCN